MVCISDGSVLMILTMKYKEKSHFKHCHLLLLWFMPHLLICKFHEEILCGLQSLGLSGFVLCIRIHGWRKYTLKEFQMWFVAWSLWIYNYLNFEIVIVVIIIGMAIKYRQVVCHLGRDWFCKCGYDEMMMSEIILAG